MRKRLTKTLTPIAVIAAGVVLYLLTIGHCFLPIPGTVHYKDERLEFWCYSSYPLALASSSQTISGSFERLAWNVRHPGYARLLAAGKRLEVAAPNPASWPAGGTGGDGLRFPAWMRRRLRRRHGTGLENYTVPLDAQVNSEGLPT